MWRKIWAAGFFLLLLIPSAQFAWRFRDMPQFGRWMYDDSVYFVCAHSLAEGVGYRIESLPEQPYQTKYPPLYPLLLSLVWRAEPAFPRNLEATVALSWLMLPVFLLLARRLYRHFGFPDSKALILTALTALNSYFILFSASMLSEMLFSCLLLGCLLLYRRAEEGRGGAMAAGVLAALAYLTRTAGLTLLVPAVLLALSRRRWRDAAAFAAPSAAAFCGWTLWVHAHQSPARDIVTMYHTNYVGYWLMDISWADLPLFVWKNLDGLLKGMGALLLPDITSSFFVKTLTQTLAVGMIVGAVRLVSRKPAAALYGWFCVLCSLMLLVWNFPLTERFALPMFPLLLAGLWTEMERLWGAVRAGLRHVQRSQRIVARAIVGLLATVFCGASLVHFYVAGVLMPADMQRQRVRRAVDEKAYQWVITNVPASARLLAYNDTLMFLYTGRRAVSLPVMPLYWYHDDDARMIERYSAVVPFAREHGLDYVYTADSDYHRYTSLEDALEVHRLIRQNPDLEVLHRVAGGTVYRIRQPVK